VELFFLLYFLMTGLHAIHLTIGIGIVGVIALLAWRRHFTSPGYMPVEVTGLYWHFVDIVWVFLFPLLYLID
jgi:cytochrome c oxidase subunit 3